MNDRTIFLLDGIGALLSLTFTGLILPHFSEIVGISKNLIYILAIFPAIYTIYSLTCYFFIKPTKPWMLLTIIFGNLIYCLVSCTLILFHETLTFIGKSLFFGEILIVLAVIALELKIYRKLPSR
jgi:hypothetical protein